MWIVKGRWPKKVSGVCRNGQRCGREGSEELFLYKRVGILESLISLGNLLKVIVNTPKLIIQTRHHKLVLSFYLIGLLYCLLVLLDRHLLHAFKVIQLTDQKMTLAREAGE